MATAFALLVMAGRRLRRFK
ncbi:hypothetical protein NPIL_381851, partial [Nephila pilipes]